MLIAHPTQAPEERSLEEDAQMEMVNTKERFSEWDIVMRERRELEGTRGSQQGFQRGVLMPSRWAGTRAASRQASTIPTSCSSASPRAAVAT